MRRIIFGAVALVAAALAAVGIAGRRRRVRVDEWLPVEPAPPIGATASGDTPTTAGDALAGEPTGAAEASGSAPSAALAESAASVEPSVEPSVETDYGPVGGSPADGPGKPRARARRKVVSATPSNEGDVASS